MTTTDDTPGAAPPDPFAAAPATSPPSASPEPEVLPGESYGAWASQWGAEEPEGSLKSWISLAALVGGLIGLGLWQGWAIVVIVLAIVLSVFLHELGHFLVARKTGMKATEFFIGFGPRIWSFKRGETEYGLKAIPAGAYVRIIGMHNLEEVEEADEARTYRSKPYLKRLSTILAGPFMNIALGVTVLAVVYATAGVPMLNGWTVEQALPGTMAATAGVEPGDRIVMVNGIDLGGDPEEAEIALRTALAGQPGVETEIVVLRDGQETTLSAPLGWRLNAGGAAALPGMADRDIVMLVDGEAGVSYDELRTTMAQATEPVTIQFQRDGRLYEIAVDPGGDHPALPEDGADGFLGVKRSSDPVWEPQSAPAAVRTAVVDAATLAGLSAQGLVRLFSPSGLSNYAGEVGSTVTGDESVDVPVGLEDLGPAPGFEDASDDADRPVSIIGIVGITNQLFARDGWPAALRMFALTNLFLGLFNLLPLLPLDGGHAAVATYEAVRSRKGRPYRVDIAKLLPVTYVVVAVLVMLGVTSMYLDVANPLQLP